MNFITYKQLIYDIYTNVHRLPQDLDCIVPICRSGLMPAQIISKILNVKIILFQDLLNGYTLNARLFAEKIPPNMKHILVVEDASGSGRTICHARDLAKHINTTRGYNIKFTFLSIYCTSFARKFSDIYIRIVEKPRAFEWNFIVNNEFSREASFDFDGILCIDPKPQQDDDNKSTKYIDFINSAQRLLVRQNTHLKYIVSGRLEQYRQNCDEWLSRNNITYDKMFLMPCASPEERTRYGIANFKSEIYSQLDSSIFVESNPIQAQQIFTQTHKPVFCPVISTLFR